MTKKLSSEVKKQRKDERRKSRQQKAKSTTVRTIEQPNPADQEAQQVNLCDDCAYEFGECDGKPKFASDQDETLTGTGADRVTECPAFLNVADMPSAQEAAAALGKPAEAYNCPPDCRFSIPSDGSADNPEVGGCAVEDKIPLESRYENDPSLPICPEFQLPAPPEEELEPEDQVIRTDLPERPDPKRFQAEEDFGTCPSCETPLKRTAFNRYQDAIRCTNGRCRAYRQVVRNLSTGVK